MLLLLLARIMQPGAGDIGKGEYGCGCGEKQHRRKVKAKGSDVIKAKIQAECRE